MNCPNCGHEVQETPLLGEVGHAPTYTYWDTGVLIHEWRGETRLVRLVLTSPAFIYHQEGRSVGREPNATPAQVAAWVRWWAGESD